jgi:hypothetical protein
MVVSRQTAEYKAKREIGKIRGFFKQTNKKVMTVGLTGLIFFLVLSPYIKDYINAPSVLPVIILGVSIFTSLGPPINIAVLQGLQDFKWMNIGISLGGPLKFLFSLILVIAGFGVNGAIGGLILTGVTI